MAVQVNLRIAGDRILLAKTQVGCQADICVGFFESPLKVPYSTDISRGY